MISENLREFHGLPVQDFKEPGAIKNLSAVAPRLRCEYDDEHTLSDYVNMLLAEPGVGGLKALVLGLWTEDGDASEANPREAIELLVSNKAQLPALEALFIGDIISEENEISWIRNGDMSPLWSAFPNLTTFGVRGTNGLRLGKINHPRLKTLTVETGGLPAAVTREALDANAPIEHFELWFGVDEYGLSTGIADLEALFAGRLFPNLKSLALRNADFADAIAQRLATAPVLDRIERLDLSFGNLRDEGAAALVASGKLGRLKALEIRHHYMSEAMRSKLAAVTNLISDEGGKPDSWGGEEHYFVSVTE